jgi:K+-sensing histidine kinase KdpD
MIQLYACIAFIIVFIILAIILTGQVMRNKKYLADKIFLQDQLKRKDDIINTLYESNKIMEEYSRKIQHDIRNPFSSFIGFADILIEDFDFLSNEDKLLYIKEIKETADRSFNYLQNLFVWENYQTKRFDLRFEKVDVTKTIQENIQQILDAAHRKQITIETDLDPKLIANANNDVVNTVIRNLLHNSLKYTRKDGLIFITALNTANMIKVIVEDNGPGINEHTQKLIYDNWEKNYASIKENNYNKSLGLVLSKELLNKIHGEIWFDTRKDVGSRFTITLPK